VSSLRPAASMNDETLWDTTPRAKLRANSHSLRRVSMKV
jgi:hypothetical protein